MKNLKHSPVLRTSIAALVTLALGQVTPSRATVLIWSGAGNTWNNPADWNPHITPAADPTLSDLVFGVAPTFTINDSGPAVVVLNSLSSARKAPKFIHTGDDITINTGGNITNKSSKLLTLSFNNDAAVGGVGIVASAFDYSDPKFPNLGRPVTINAAKGNILITCNIGLEGTGGSLIFTGAHNTNVTGGIFELGVANTLVKNGKGTLTLSGRSTYPGSTSVNDGTLIVNGSIASANTFVNHGGTLGGSGVVFGNVFNSGNVAPGNSPGTLNIGGTYSQSRKGTLTIEIGMKSNDLLAVRGRANLDGTLRVVRSGHGPGLCLGDNVTILTAGGGVNGGFSKVRSDTGTITVAKVDYRSNSVVVEGAQGSFEEHARKVHLTVNQRALAGGLDKVAFRNNPGKLIRFLDCEPLGKLPAYFDQIAPDELASIFHIGMALANVQGINLQRRTADIRAGSNGLSVGGLAIQGNGPNYAGTIQFRTGAAGPTGSEGKESKSVYTPLPDNRWGVFLTGVGEWVDVNGDGNARGYDITTGGFTLGLDYKITPNLAIGLSAGYAGTGANLNNGGRVFVNGGKLGLYGTYFDGGFYVDTAVTGGYNSYDTRRNALRGTARGSTDGGELNVLVGTGYDWKSGGLTVGPTATYQYTYVGFGGYTERGSLAPLNVASQDAESKRSALGLKASYDWKVGGVVIRPELRAAWQHEYGDTSYSVVSSFSNLGSNSFSVNGSSIGRDSLLVGAGFAIVWNERTSTYVYYDGELFRTSYDSNSVSGGIRIAF